MNNVERVGRAFAHLLHNLTVAAAEVDCLRQRAETLEAECTRLRKELDAANEQCQRHQANPDYDEGYYHASLVAGKFKCRAEAAEAECARLRERVAELEAAPAPPCDHDWEPRTTPAGPARCRLCGLTEDC
jgi:chromosome segregation ATPase